ncbi:hypothetical protein [Mycoplasmoides alvi]|uniref:hypothetical protein n=1 Tax=Mycoplasmoides alvi TaxID=78580 RepID=UPI00051BA183|nr:hypothetical protein [Mycoplasmoides alvi]
MHLRIRYKPNYLNLLEKELINHKVIIKHDKNGFTSYTVKDNLDDTYTIDENNWDHADAIIASKKGYQKIKSIIQGIRKINQTLKPEDQFVITFCISKLEYFNNQISSNFDYYTNFTTEDLIRNLAENTINECLPNHKELIINIEKV